MAQDEVYVEAVNFSSSRLLLKRLRERWPEVTVVEEYDGAALVQLPLYQRAQGVINHSMEIKIGGVKLSPVLYLSNERGSVRDEATRRLAMEEVVVQAESQKEAKKLAKHFGKGSLLVNQKKRKLWILKYKTAWDALEQAQAMQQKGIEAQVMMARMMARRLVLNDSLYFELWHLKDQSPLASVPLDMNVELAWDSVSGLGVGLAIVDDGLDVKHPDLKAHIPKRRERLNVNFNRRKISYNPKPKRHDIHGTACAGLAAAVGNNAKGVAGVAYDATLIGIRLIAKPFTDEEAAMAMKWRPDRISIYSSSWGPFDSGLDLVEASPGPLLQEALQEGGAIGAHWTR
ncbi:MAG: S8 family serine peptidase [Verrucomicrobiia bacterium]